MRLPYTPVLVISENVAIKINESVNQGFPLITGKAEEICNKMNLLKNSVLNNPVVVGDINPRIAGNDVEQSLLKVLEGLCIDVMFFSSVDCFSSTFLSRFAVVIKDDELIESTFNSRASFIQVMKTDMPTVEALRKILKESPAYLPFFMAFKDSRMPSKLKLLEFLA